MLKNPNYIYGSRDVKIPLSINFGEYIIGVLRKFSDRTAFLNGATNEQITFGEIADHALSLAVTLHEMGVKKGDVVAVCTENRNEFWATIIGIVCTGATATCMNYTYVNNELKHVLEISKPVFIFCSPLALQTHQSVLRMNKTIKKIFLYGDKKMTADILYKDMITRKINYDDFSFPDVVGQVDTLMILYSSGTTGLPKGVMVTHLNAIVSCTSMSVTDESVPSMTTVKLAPWYHAMGMWGNFGTLCNGRCTVYLPKFEETTYLECIQKYKPDILTLVPPILVVLAKSQIISQYDVSSVVLIFCGAAPTDEDIINGVKSNFPNLAAILQGYGMTESTLSITTDVPTKPDGIKEGSVGQAVVGTVIKVVDVKTRQPLGPNQRGEICVKGAHIMKGYVGRSMKEDIDEEGFFKTGDIGYYDEEKFFYIVDRLKELIKYKGYQVAPAELEAQLLQHPAVRDAAVIGRPDKMAGEVPLAFIVVQPGKEVTAKEIQDFIASKLSNPKHLRGGVRFVNEIPKNPSGKILRRELRNIIKLNKSKL